MATKLKQEARIKARESLEKRGYKDPQFQKYEIKTNDGKDLGSVSYGAYRAIKENRLDNYRPTNDEEKRILENIKNYMPKKSSENQSEESAEMKEDKSEPSFFKWIGSSIINRGFANFDNAIKQTILSIEDILGDDNPIVKGSKGFFTKTNEAISKITGIDYDPKKHNLSTSLEKGIQDVEKGDAIGKQKGPVYDKIDDYASMAVSEIVPLVSTALLGKPVGTAVNLVRMFGPSYYEAKEEGATNGEAAITALINSTGGTIIEMAGGPEKLLNSPKTIVKWLKSAVEEGGEEVVQDVLDNTIRKVVYDEDRKIFSTEDEDAIINPGRAAEAFAGGAIVGGVLGGVQTGLSRIAQAKSFADVGKQYRSNADNIIQAGSEYGKNTQTYKTSQELAKKVLDGKEISNTELGKYVTNAILEADKARIVSSQEDSVLTSLEDTLIDKGFTQSMRKEMLEKAINLYDTAKGVGADAESAISLSSNLAQDISQGWKNNKAKNFSELDISKYSIDFLSDPNSVIDEKFIDEYAEEFSSALIRSNSRAFSRLTDGMSDPAEYLKSYIRGGEQTNAVGETFKRTLQDTVSKSANAKMLLYGDNPTLSAQAEAIRNGDFSVVAMSSEATAEQRNAGATAENASNAASNASNVNNNVNSYTSDETTSGAQNTPYNANVEQQNTSAAQQNVNADIQNRTSADIQTNMNTPVETSEAVAEPRNAAATAAPAMTNTTVAADMPTAINSAAVREQNTSAAPQTNGNVQSQTDNMPDTEVVQRTAVNNSAGANINTTQSGTVDISDVSNLQQNSNANSVDSTSSARPKSNVGEMVTQMHSVYNPTVSKRETTRAINDIYSTWQKGFDTNATAEQQDAYIKEASNKALELGRNIVDNSRITEAVSNNEGYDELKKELRTTSISISNEDKSDINGSGGFNEFRKKYFGKLRISNNGVPVDTYYSELSASYPELFPDNITHPGDRLQRIAEVQDMLYSEPKRREMSSEEYNESVLDIAATIIGEAERYIDIPRAAVEQNTEAAGTQEQETPSMRTETATSRRTASEAGIAAENGTQVINDYGRAVEDIMTVDDETARISADNNYVENLVSKDGVTVPYQKEDLSQVNPQLYKWLAIVNDKSSSVDNSISQDSAVVNRNDTQETENHLDGQTKGLIEDEYSAMLDKNEKAAIDELAEICGIKVKILPSIEGGSANGIYKNGTAYIALDAEDKPISVFAHEITHHFEDTAPKSYAKYKKAVFGIYEADGASIETHIKDITDRYSEYGIKLSKTEAEAELVADYTHRIIESPEKAFELIDEAEDIADGVGILKRLSEAIKNLIGRITEAFGGRTAADISTLKTDKLNEAVKALEDMIIEAETNSSDNNRSRRSLKKGMNGKAVEFSEQVDRWQNGNMEIDEVFNLGNTPQVMKSLGADDLPIIMTQKVMHKITGGKHDIPISELKKLPENLESPVMVFRSATMDNAYVILTEMTDSSGDSVVAALHLNKKQNRLRVNRIASVYGKDKIENFIRNQADAGNLLYADKKKSQQWSTSRGLQLPKLVQSIADTNSISHNSKNVNNGKTSDKNFNPKPAETNNERRSVKGVGNMADLIERYGRIPTGENTARKVDVPNKISETQYVSRFARTAMEAGVTPENVVSEFERAILDGTMTHEAVTDKSAMQYADNKIKEEGFDGALEQWNALSGSGHYMRKKDMALGQQLYNQCVNNKDVANAMKIAADLCAEATRAGQSLQAVRMLKRMSPDGQLYYLEKTVQKINDDFRERIGEKYKNVTLDEELMKQYLEAKTDKKRNEVYDKICLDIAEQIPAKIKDKWNAWRYLSMLGNPRTHIRNIIGNAVFWPAVRIKGYIAAAIEKGTVKPEERTSSFRKTPESKRYAKKDFEAVKKELQGVNAKYAITDDIESKRRIFKNRTLEFLRKKNSDLMEAEDMWFLKSYYEDAFARVMTARKISGTLLDSGTKEGAEALQKIRAVAMREAQEATYRDANTVAEALSRAQRWAEKNPNRAVRAAGAGIEAVMPFKKTPLNIAKRGIEYSPIGCLLYTSDKSS